MATPPIVTPTAAAHVGALMKQMVEPFVMPLSMQYPDGLVSALGSASLITDGTNKYLITNAHVASVATQYTIACKFNQDMNIIKILTPIATISDPSDVAISDITPLCDNFMPKTAAAIPLDKFSSAPSADPEELFFLIGFPGEAQSIDIANKIFSQPPACILAQEKPFSNIPRYGKTNQNTFALNYDLFTAIALLKPVTWHKAPGMSGSLIWNTRYVESVLQGVDWDPSMATVAGIQCMWNNQDTLFATKENHMFVNDLIDCTKNNTKIQSLPMSSMIFPGYRP